MTYIPPVPGPIVVTNFEDVRLTLNDMRDWIVALTSKLDALKVREQNGPLPFAYDYSVNVYDTSSNVTSTTYRTGGATGSIVWVYRYTYDALGNLLTQTGSIS